jgi:hypothetical protein
MTKKQLPYDQIRHQLETDMIQASGLKTKPEQQGFVNRTFTSLHKSYQDKRVNHSEYVKLLNRLSVYAGGSFNDYIDLLTGAARMGMLELALQGELSQMTPEAARKRSQTITQMTGVQPIQPDKGGE